MDYESKIIVIEQALALVKSGDVIVTGLGASEAGVFMMSITYSRSARCQGCNGYKLLADT